MSATRRTIYELVFSTDEAYYTVAHFEDEGDAVGAAGIGNAGFRSDQYSRFEVRPRVMFDSGSQPYSDLASLKDELDATMGGYLDDYFMDVAGIR